MSCADSVRDAFRNHIAENVYPGRGIVIGRDGAGAWTLVYWIMGRSDHSRNRRFVAAGGVLRTEPVVMSKVADPSLIIYDAMRELPGVQIVTNGDQTRTIHGVVREGGTFESALMTREREPDAPNYTPRISAMLDLRHGTPELHLGVLKANVCDPAYTDHWFYRPHAPVAGCGYCLTTYMGDGNPLPSFVGDPLVLPLAGDADEILGAYWDALDDDNRISLAVKTIAPDGTCRGLLVRNRHGDA